MTITAFGIDIGGSGVKGAPVNLKAGKFDAPRFRLPTPQPSTPAAVVDVIAEILDHFEVPQDAALGITFPGVVQHDVIRTAANVDESWIGVNLRDAIAERTGHRSHVLNDADAAGYAEFLYGQAAGRDGTVLITTLGTGIGTSLIVDGTLVPNLEMGHLIIDGHDAEEFTAESARERHGLSDAQWISHLQRYYSEMEKLLWPELIIVGGGISTEHEKFLPHLQLRAPIIPAELFNAAGIVGAAAYAARADARAEKRKQKKDAKKKSKK